MFRGAQGASQLPGCEGEGGPVSFGVVLFCGECFRAVKGEGGESALEFGVVVVGFCFGGRRGRVSFRAVKGKGGESALEFGGGVVVGFCFGGRRGPVSFRAVKGKGGQSALELSCSAGNGGESVSQLWSLVVVLLSVFVLGGAGGQSASGL